MTIIDKMLINNDESKAKGWAQNKAQVLIDNWREGFSFGSRWRKQMS